MQSSIQSQKSPLPRFKVFKYIPEQQHECDQREDDRVRETPRWELIVVVRRRNTGDQLSGFIVAFSIPSNVAAFTTYSINSRGDRDRRS